MAVGKIWAPHWNKDVILFAAEMENPWIYDLLVPALIMGIEVWTESICDLLPLHFVI